MTDRRKSAMLLCGAVGWLVLPLACMRPAGRQEAIMQEKLEALVRAIDDGDLDTVSRLLDEDPSLVRARPPGRFDLPLHVALQGSPRPKRREVVELLLARGADVRARGDQGMTPLEFAASYGVTEVAETLLAHGASLEEEAGSGTTPLLLAAGGKNPLSCRDFIALLLRHGANLRARDRDGHDAMTLAGAHDNFPVIEFLAEHGLPLDLLAALTSKRPELVRKLLREDPQLVRKHPDASLLLPKAVTMLRELMEDRGALEDPQKAEAVVREDLDILELMLAQGVPRTSEFTMEEAVQMPHPAVLAVLLRHGVDPPRPDGVGLVELARRNRACGDAMVELLQQHGVRPTLPPAQAPAAVMRLAEKLRDPDPMARWLAAVALEAHGPRARAVVPALRKAADEDVDADVRSAARRALKYVDPDGGGGANPAAGP